jgi:hypothetical protein
MSCYKPLDTLFNILIHALRPSRRFASVFCALAAALCVTIFAPCSAFSAEEVKRIYSAEFEKNAVTYIFGENTNVRKSGKIEAGNIVAKLEAGRKVKILSKGSEYTIDGFTQNWYEIEYESGGKTGTGFVWGGFLAMAFVFTDGEEKGGAGIALAGIKKYSLKEGFTGELRMCENGKIISRAEFVPHNMAGGEKQSAYTYGVSASISGPAGLAGVKNIIKVSCVYEACGYPNGSSYFAWDGKDVKYITKDEYISEAGCFHYEKKIIFPEEKGGEKGRIIVEENSSEFDEAKNDYVLKSSKKEIFEFKAGKLLKK